VAPVFCPRDQVSVGLKAMGEKEMIELVDVCLDHPRGGAALVTEGNLQVARGEVVMVVGAAGVGTSRLVAAMLGEAQTRSGRIEVLGRDVAKLRRASLRLLRRRIGIVPQDLCLLEDRSAQLNVVLPLEIDGIPRSMSVVRAGEILARLGLESEASLPVDCLSASARQRVAVARALVREPSLVIADHPTSLQDAEGAELVCRSLAEVALTGAAVLIFGRDPALREIAERRHWRQLGLVNGRLRPLAEIELEGTTIEELLIGIDSAAIRPIAEDVHSNLLPFPVTGVA
ncbi:MAG: transporter related protein, partial [Myxococcales bacterium]|nr:transporter related protein [Myxococcales bacterium]